MTWWQILLLILGIILVLLIVLYFFGTRLQKKQNASQEQMEAMKQVVSLLVIDKKRMKMKEANLPAVVLEQTPKYMRRMKMPFVKAKIGPQITTLIADPKVYEIIPVKKECKVVLSGIYITDLLSVRGGTVPKPPEKKGLFGRKKKKEAAGANASASAKTSSSAPAQKAEKKNKK